jgi:hypothetical protein
MSRSQNEAVKDEPDAAQRRREAAKALLDMIDTEGFAIDLAAIDCLNDPQDAHVI